MKISRTAQSVHQSVTMAVTARAQQLCAQGRDIISFSAGEPDFDTPARITDRAVEALQTGHTRYAPAVGRLDLRNQIARHLQTQNHLTYQPDQIVVTVGAKHAVYLALHALLDPGDQVLIPAPYWVSYPEMVQLVGAVPRIVTTRADDDWNIHPDLLQQSITDRTALLILNSPNNPGGFCYRPDELAALGSVIADADLAVISDEVYDQLTYTDTPIRSFAAAAPDCSHRTVTVNGFSKAYAMTGWRLGYAAAPTETAQALARLQSHMTSGPATFCQLAALTALLQGQPEIERMRAVYAQRARHIHQRLTAIPHITCTAPTGAFYVFPDVSVYYPKVGVTNSVEFCQRLLEHAGVACVPGQAFGCDSNIRLSFATATEDIDRGLDRLAAFLQSPPQT